MKALTCFIVFGLLSVLVSCATGAKVYSQKHRRLLYKTEPDTTRGLYKQHIDVVDRRRPAGVGEDTLIILNNLDDRDIMTGSKYTRAESIEVLKEFLTFQGDTVPSNKRYFFPEDYVFRQPKEKEHFTIEVEALYSFTKMLTIGLSPIKPVIIERQTGKSINADRKKMDEVYAIYKRWFADNSKTNFMNMTWPLANTPYRWLGDDKDLAPYWKKSYRTPAAKN